MPGEPAALGRQNTRWLLAWGLAVWAAVAVTIRLVGHHLLDPGAPLVVGAFFAATVPLMALVTDPVYRRLAITAARPRAAILLSLPGLVLDVLLVAFAPTLLPNLTPGATRLFAAILLFGYAVVLLTGVLPRR